MKGFKIIDGDVSITDGNIDMAEDTELEIQTMKTVLMTSKGEDVFDDTEGINLRQILGKGITDDMVKTQAQSGVNQVNADYTIEDFSFDVDNATRHATVKFTAKKTNGAAISVSNSYS